MDRERVRGHTGVQEAGNQVLLLALAATLRHTAHAFPSSHSIVGRWLRTNKSCLPELVVTHAKRMQLRLQS